MPVRDEFLAMIYDNLADCYEKDDLYDIAIEAYRQAYQILEGGKSADISIERYCAYLFITK